MDDDVETGLCCEIQGEVKELSDSLVKASRKLAILCTQLSNTEDAIRKL